MSATDVSPSSSFSSAGGGRVEDNSLIVDSKSPAQPALAASGPTTAETEKHPKAKRKRTAAKDKTILEAAYKANPKPDKRARLDLVQQVSLNEKEVQIWFQNRRQNDRRKSRPLSPQEVAALRSGGMQVLSSDPVTSTSQLADRTSPVAGPSPAATPDRPSDPGPPVSWDSSFEQSFQEHEKGFGASAEEEGEAVVGKRGSQTTSRASQSDPQKMPSISNSTGCSSKHWNLSSSFSTPSTLGQSGDRLRLEPFSSSPPTSSSGPVLPLPQSNVRISLSLEGKAELVSNNESPPGPRPSNTSPLLHPAHAAHRALNRSQSAVLNVSLPPISALTNARPPSLSRGRSRDAQAWELCCDADKRDELTAQAENESTGSAVAAISLLRSSSNVLQSHGSKRNAPPLKCSSRSHQGKKPRLSRTMSSNAVMQKSFSVDAVVPPISPNHKHAKSSVLLSLSGDSDKENVSPDGEEELPRNGPLLSAGRRPLPSGACRSGNPRRQGGVLREQQAPWLLGNGRANTAPLIPRRDSGKGLEIFEDAENQIPQAAPRSNDEVEKIMRGEVSPSKKGDMDCIAGLLSLSQGNWR